MRVIILIFALSFSLRALAFLSGPISGGGAVSSVNGQIGAVVLTKSDVSLSLADNTSDLSKPISTLSQLALNAKLSKGSRTKFVIDNGDYATLQAAVDAAASGDVLVVGAKATSWGDVTFPAQKTLTILCLNAPYGASSEIGRLTYSPTSGANPTLNLINVARCFINGAGPVVTYGGTATSRFKIYESNIFNSSTSSSAIVINNSHATNGFYLEDTIVAMSSGNTSAPAIDTTSTYLPLRRVTISNGNAALKITSGSVSCDNCNMDYNRSGEVVLINGGSFVAGNGTLIANSHATGDGVKIANAASIFSYSNSGFSIPSISGYCVRGAGVYIYAYVAFSDSVLGAQNKKIQNTLTIIPYTITHAAIP